MRLYQLLSVFCVVLASVGVLADDRKPIPPKVDAVALEKKVADIERQLIAIQNELHEVRRALRAQAKPDSPALTPEQAVEAFKRDPTSEVTVEFGVDTVGWPDGPISIDDDPTPSLLADWDGRLANGGLFSLFLTGKTVRVLDYAGLGLPPAEPPGLVDLARLSQLSKHLKGKGVRVTGTIRASRPGDRHTSYTIVVDDATKFKINK